MMNEALLYPSYEIIGGEKILAPSASSYHNEIMGDLFTDLKLYVRKNHCGRVFTDNVDLYLPDGSRYKPDLVVVKTENENIIDKRGGIHGVPDMVVEILSKSTKKKDTTIKKDTYELNGVKEYWIVDPFMEVVDVYLLKDGKYYLDGEYIYYNEDEWETLNDEQKAENKSEITLATFPDLTIKLSDIFYSRKWR